MVNHLPQVSAIALPIGAALLLACALNAPAGSSPSWLSLNRNPSLVASDGYTPPNNGGPDSSQGSGTRCIDAPATPQLL